MSEDSQPEILIGTTNQAKIKEIRRALADLPLRLRFLDEYPTISPPVEDGQSYEENAVLKASAYARHTGISALADDSGLEVAYLHGAPGLRSARFGGPSDSDRVDLLLSKLTAAPDHERQGRFVSVVAIADAEGAVFNIAQGICAGTIAHAPLGSGGFGYDPVFVPEGYQLTFGQLPANVKDRISHRALALAATRVFLSRAMSANLTPGE
ncbi:MAG: non-canonical purine NTP pyrophosphatase [Acidobacteriota bacterium]